MKIDVQLTDEDLQDRATTLAATCEEITKLKEEKKEVDTDYNERIGTLEKERARLARIVRTRQEEREEEPPLLKMSEGRRAKA